MKVCLLCFIHLFQTADSERFPLPCWRFQHTYTYGDANHSFGISQLFHPPSCGHQLARTSILSTEPHLLSLSNRNNLIPNCDLATPIYDSNIAYKLLKTCLNFVHGDRFKLSFKFFASRWCMCFYACGFSLTVL